MNKPLVAAALLALTGCMPEKGTLEAYNNCFEEQKNSGLSEVSARAICSTQEEVQLAPWEADVQGRGTINWHKDTLSAKVSNSPTRQGETTFYVVTSMTVAIKVGQKEVEIRKDGIWIEPKTEEKVVFEFASEDFGPDAQTLGGPKDWSWTVTSVRGLSIE
jgi:hypothetical protein